MADRETARRGAKNVTVATLIEACPRAAFVETLHIVGTATNGWPGALYAKTAIPHAFALSNT